MPTNKPHRPQAPSNRNKQQRQQPPTNPWLCSSSNTSVIPPLSYQHTRTVCNHKCRSPPSNSRNAALSTAYASGNNSNLHLTYAIPQSHPATTVSPTATRARLLSLLQWRTPHVTNGSNTPSLNSTHAGIYNHSTPLLVYTLALYHHAANYAAN
jgi:hypothetical protein